MAFDIEGARRAGYSTDEVVGFLAAEQKFDADAARKSGYSADELLQHLAESDAALQPEPASMGQQAARGLGLGVRDVVEGAAAIPGMAYDLVGTGVNALLAGVERIGGPSLPRVNSAAQNVSGTLTAAGLPEAETATEQGLSAGIRGAASTLPTMGAGVAMQGAKIFSGVANALSGGMMSQVVGGATAGLATEGARQNGLSPIAQLGAGLVGGVAGAAGVSAGAAALRGGRALAMPFTESGRQSIVGDVLMRSSGRPDTLAARIGAGADPLVPGSVPTTAEAARDPGLASLQRAVQGMDPAASDAFALRDAARDTARRQAAVAIEPTEGGAPRLAQSVRDSIAREEQRFQGLATQAGQQLDEGLAGLPQRAMPEQVGATLRGELGQAQDVSRAATSRAFNAIDPEGVSRLPLGPVQEAARNAEAQFFGDMAGPMPRELRSALDDIHETARDVAPFRSLQNLRSRLGELAGHPDQRVKAVAMQLRQSIDETSERAALPYERPSRPTTLDDIERQFASEGAGQNPDIARRLEMSRDELGAAGNSSPAPGGLSLVQFLRRNGGLRNEGGEIGNMMGGTARTMPGFMNQQGMTLDQAAEAAFQGGYLRGTRYSESGPGGATQRDLLDALDAELRGEAKNYAGGEVRNLRGGRGASLADDLDREVQARGGQYDPADPQGTLRSLRQVDENAPGAGADVPERFAPIPDAFTPEQAEQWRAAQAARREQGERFDRGPVRDVLATRMGGPLVPDSGVAARVFRPGAGGLEAVRQVLTAAGDRPAAVHALEAHAATSLRDFASRADGTLDPAKWQAWMSRHEGALRELPELSKRLRSVGDAAATVERVAGLQKASVADVEKGVARYFLGRDPEKAVQAALGAGDAAKGIGELRRLVGSDPEAVRALRRAYLDEWMRRAETTTLDAQGGYRLSPAAASRFARDSGGAARQIFDVEDIKRIEALVSDFASGAFPASAGRASGSNTYQNLSTANFIARASAGVVDPSNAIAQALGSGFGILQKFAYAQPEALMRDMLREAMLEPTVAKNLLSRATAESVQRAIGYVERSAGDRLREAAGNAVVRQGIRSAGSDTSRRPEPQYTPRNALMNPAAANAMTGTGARNRLMDVGRR
jgi:hypothetical protein